VEGTPRVWGKLKEEPPESVNVEALTDGEPYIELVLTV